jgi:hypothetical protein
MSLSLQKTNGAPKAWLCSRANGSDDGVRRLSHASCVCDAYYMFKCSDCGDCTQCTDEYYMVEDEVWYSAITARSKPAILCIGCLESRLGRLLTKDDFSDAPLNSMPFWPRSERLSARLNQ